MQRVWATNKTAMTGEIVHYRRTDGRCSADSLSDDWPALCPCVGGRVDTDE